MEGEEAKAGYGPKGNGKEGMTREKRKRERGKKSLLARRTYLSRWLFLSVFSEPSSNGRQAGQPFMRANDGFTNSATKEKEEEKERRN